MDLKELKALLRLMEGNDVEELEVEEGGRRVRIRRRSGDGTPATLVRSGQPGQPGAKFAAGPVGAAMETAGLVPIESPMVGTFYRAPAPGADPYVKEGDLIQKGTVVCIVEAMKLMNEIESEVGGRIVKIVVENGKPVEFGQALFLVEPS
jgi:acetyl-CoA carboxylase biotin carboxyl carrier protein